MIGPAETKNGNQTMPQTEVQRLANEVQRLSTALYSIDDADAYASTLAWEALSDAAEQLLQSEPENATDALALAWFGRQYFRAMMQCQTISPADVAMFERNQRNLIACLECLSGQSVEIFSDTPEAGGGVH